MLECHFAAHSLQRAVLPFLLGYLAGGLSEAEIVSQFPQLTRDEIMACLAHVAGRSRRGTSQDCVVVRSQTTYPRSGWSWCQHEPTATASYRYKDARVKTTADWRFTTRVLHRDVAQVML